MKAQGVLFILAILGSLCSALQPGLEYHYHYSGRVATGITDLKNQFAAAGIEADVTIEVAEDYTAIFQFSHIQVGDYHDEVKCDVRAPLPIEYHALEYGVELLETPFRVKIDQTKTGLVFEYLEVPQEPVWITNIRKSIINIFRITPFGPDSTAEKLRPDDLHYLDYNSMEETIVGQCINWYGTTKLPAVEATIFDKEHEVEDDVQMEGTGQSGGLSGTKGRKGAKGVSKTTKTSKSSKTSKSRYTYTGPKISDILWTVTKTTDFDQCDYLNSGKSHITRETEELFSRTSVSSYTIRGDTEGMRIEKAYIEGSITVFTQEDRKDHYDTLTNQTLNLKAVRKSDNHLTIDYEVQHFTSFKFWVGDYATIVAQSEDGVPDIEQVLTGIALTPATIEEIKLNIYNSINHIVSREEEVTHTNTLVEEIGHVVESISVLGYSHLEELHRKLTSEAGPGTKSKKLVVFYQAVIAEGRESTLKFMLNVIPTEEFQGIYPELITVFFQSLPHTLKFPDLIPKIMEVVMQLVPSGHAPNLEKATPLIYFSDLLGTFCFGNNQRSVYWRNGCQKPLVCDSDAVASKYIPYLKEKLQDETAPIWQRYIVLKAVANLKTPLVLDILKPYVLGSEEYDIAFRKSAIFALSKGYLPSTAMGQVLNWLMAVFENAEEDDEVRSIAFIVMATWEADVAWWSRMAMATWREPSSRLANFISTTIKTTARLKDEGPLARFAREVEHLAKPPLPASVSESANYFLLDFLHSSQNDRFMALAWLSHGEQIFPSEIYLRLSFVTHIGYPVGTMVNIHTNAIDIWIELLVNMLKGTPKVNQDAVEIVQGMYEEIKEKLGYEPSDETPQTQIFVRLQKAIIGIYSSAMASRDGLFTLLPRTYSRTRRVFFLPTDLGLPFVALHNIEESIWGNQPLSGTFKVELARRLQFEAKTLIPWSGKSAIGTRSDKLLSLNLPFKLSFEPDLESKTAKLTFEIDTTNKNEILDLHHIPSTVQYGAFPTNVHEDTREYKVIHVKEKCIYDDKLRFPPSGELNFLEFSWRGDALNPLSIKNIFSQRRYFSITTQKFWEAHLTYDPARATTKGVVIRVIYISTDKTSRLVEVDGEMGTGQGSVDYGDYTQFSQSSSSGGFGDYSQFSQSSGGQEFGEVDFIGQQQTSATQARIAKLQEQVVPASGGHVRSISFDFNLYGSVNKSYAALFTWASGASSSRRQTKFQFTWIKEVPIGTLGEPESTCLNFKIDKPDFEPFTLPEQVLESNFHSTFSIDLHKGTDCSSPALLEVEGTMDVGPEQMAEARRQLTERDCGGQPELRPIELITLPIYDHITAKAHWEETLPIGFKNFTYHIYDIIRGLRFPNVQFDYTVTNPANQLTVDAEKCLETEKWTLHVNKEHENTIVENVKLPYLLSVVASPASAVDKLIFDRLNSRELTACVIMQDWVRTYDGVVYPFEPSECWTVIGIDNRGMGSLDMRVHDGQWETRLVIPSEGLLIEMTHSTIRVNGEDFSGQDPRFDIHHVSDGNILIFNYFTNGYIKVTEDAVYVLEEQLFRGKVGGICGNFDGDTRNELVGPQGCIYTDPDLFAKSWMTSGEGCSGFSYLGKKKPVQAYQDACPQVTHTPTGVTYTGIVEEHCTTWAYKEIEHKGRHCRSIEPVPVCGPGCHSSTTVPAKIMFDCELAEEPLTGAPKCMSIEMTAAVPDYCVEN